MSLTPQPAQERPIDHVLPFCVVLEVFLVDVGRYRPREDCIRPNAIFPKCNRAILHQISYGRFRWAIVAVEGLVNST